MTRSSFSDELPPEHTTAVRRVLSAEPLADSMETERLWDGLSARMQGSGSSSAVRLRGLGARTAVFGAGAVAMMGLVLAFGSSRPREAMHVYTTHRGERASILLQDRSTIVLAPSSTVIIARPETGRERVQLLGEGYFSVRSSSRVPLTVWTKDVATRVLGTTFIVRRYADDISTHIAVVEGRVAVSNAHRQIVVPAGGAVIASDSNAIQTDTNVVAENWMHGRLVFNETPIPAVLATLRRWYRYDFRIADSALACKVVTGEFRIDALDETLAGLKDILGVSLQFNSDTITLAPRHEVPARRRERERVPSSMEIGK